MWSFAVTFSVLDIEEDAEDDVEAVLPPREMALEEEVVEVVEAVASHVPPSTLSSSGSCCPMSCINAWKAKHHANPTTPKVRKSDLQP
jgi:hypothetical protein